MVIPIAAFVVVTTPLCSIVKQRGQTYKKRASVSALVMDICRPEDLRLDGDLCVAEPQRPSDAYLSSKTSTTYLFDCLTPADYALLKLRNPPLAPG